MARPIGALSTDGGRGSGPSLNLLPPRPQAKAPAGEPTLNLTTTRPTLELFTSRPFASFVFAPQAGHQPSHSEAAFILSPAPRTSRPTAQSWFFQTAARSRAAQPRMGAAASAVRWATGAPLSMVQGLVAGLLLLLLVALPFGYRTFVVMSGSMEPALHAGDVVIDQRIAAAHARVGDVITYRDPDDPARLITHRVEWVGVSGDRVTFVTKGDAQNSSQRWSFPSSGTVGVVRFRIVKLGYVLARINTPLGHFCLIVVPLLLLGADSIASIWRTEPKESRNSDHRLCS